ncbi:hypothetical protein PVV74_17515 [Roseovarius sp. SK2]|uniref:hypothetical protein n=1 Tax=Roseovarius TaxID=74030 RepID=UPI00237A3428|nr:hypothetical protein [Roseovarius sp. SK2]MDD9727261.1 hypothetical protein [Roseovarius sp. SK2]
MPRGKSKRIGASIVAQARARSEKSTRDTANVTSLTARERLHSRIDRSPDPEAGSPRIRVIIPGGAEPEIYDFTLFLRQPEIAELIVEGFRCWAQPAGFRARDVKCGDLRRGLASHLESYPPMAVTLETIDEAFWTGFLRFLDAPNADDQPWAVKTRAGMLGAVRLCIEALENNAAWGERAKRLLYHSGFPSNPWAGRTIKNKPTEVILPHEVDRILTACLADVAAIQKRLDRNTSILEVGQCELDDARGCDAAPDYSCLSVCAARIHEAFPDRLASLKDLSRLDRDLGNAVNRHGMRAIREVLYNTFEDLVPFVVLIGFKTIFNPDPLLSLEWNAIETSFDGSTLIFHTKKNRSNRTQTSTHNASEIAGDVRLPAESGTPLGLQDLLNILKRLTLNSRAILANKTDDDRLFLGAPKWGGSVAKAFNHRGGPSNDIVWKKALGGFIERYDLAPFTLNLIRATGADQTRRYFGIFAQQERQGHSSPKTTWTFYTSDWVRKQGQDRIGETQELYARAAETHGRIDPRGLGANGQQAAATPGFLCLDPYHSPRPAQESGKLCAAYGECPSCPLAAAQPRSDEAVARYLALRRAIYTAQHGRVSALQWKEKWVPILRDLEALLEQVPMATMNNAQRYHVTLPSVA